MNILHVVPSLSKRFGGPAKAVLELSEALVHAGQKVSIFATDHGFENGGYDADLDQSGVRIGLFKRRWPKCYFHSPSFGKALEHEIRNFDVVHIHGLWTYPTLVASRLSQRNGIPYLIRPCGMLDPYCLSHHGLRKKIYYLFFEKSHLARARVIHFTTEEEKEHSQVSGLALQMVVIPLGLKLEDYFHLPPHGSFRKQFLNLDGKKLVVFLGRINFKKGLDLLVGAFSELVKEIEGVHCVIAGPDDEGYGRKLRWWIREKGIEDHVTIIGFLDGEKKLALLRDSDVFCLLSHQENFGIAVVEAMAVGLPVVVSDQMNLGSEIKSHQAGVVTSMKCSEIASHLHHLLENDHLRHKMGQNGQRLVHEKYRWDKIAEELIRVYERLLSVNR
ncbi:MAG: glycosyltransferase [Candidatus Omnitrophica bacterium]|nr:glycosyltransferase [Candidatus Omnitrophota bacterium]